MRSCVTSRMRIALRCALAWSLVISQDWKICVLWVRFLPIVCFVSSVIFLLLLALHGHSCGIQSDNEIGDEGARHIAQALSVNNSVYELDLVSCCFTHCLFCFKRYFSVVVGVGRSLLWNTEQQQNWRRGSKTYSPSSECQQQRLWAGSCELFFADVLFCFTRYYYVVAGVGRSLLWNTEREPDWRRGHEIHWPSAEYQQQRAVSDSCEFFCRRCFVLFCFKRYNCDVVGAAWSLVSVAHFHHRFHRYFSPPAH